jgi:hypothetical protein
MQVFYEEVFSKTQDNKETMTMTTKKQKFDTSAKYSAVHDLYPLGEGKRTMHDGMIGNIRYEGEGKEKVMIQEFKTPSAALKAVYELKHMPGHSETNPRVMITYKKQKTNSRRKPVTTKRKLVGRCK